MNLLPTGLRFLRTTGFAFCVATASGCASASLATNTGPTAPDRSWSIASRQHVHVGETVTFDLVLLNAWGRFRPPADVADYAVLQIEKQRYEAEPDAQGHFVFQHRFDRVKPGDKFKVQASIYRQHGARDFVNIRNEWHAIDQVGPQKDKRIAAADVEFVFYQAAFEQKLAAPPDDLDPDSGVLRLHRRDGSGTAVYIHRDLRPGFTLTGPGADGYYRLTYQPKAAELNPTDSTPVEFTVYDVAGRKHVSEWILPTP